MFSYHELKEQVYRMLNEYTGLPIGEKRISEDVMRNQEEYRRMVSTGIRSCCSGNYGAKEMVKELIRAYIINKLGMKAIEIEAVLPAHLPEKLSARQMFEFLIYMEDRDTEKGFQKLWENSGWKESGENVSITEEMVRGLYVQKMDNIEREDSLMVLSQLLFADTVGLGVIDTLNQQQGCIEEIQLGMNGLAENVYNYREEVLYKTDNKLYARDGIHVLIQGKMVWLRFLSFGTEAELRRVLTNLIKDSKAGELTRNHPMIVVDTIDGRRVSVSRPPMTDSWVGLIRKFDTVTATSLESLYAHEENGVLAELLRWIVRSGRNIAITGEMASGKTTLFRACLRETEKDRNLRIIEVDSFELNVRGFLPERNSVTMRISDETPAEEVLGFARKTTGQIFAVGEISSPAVAVMMMDLSKIATQLFFSAHYVTTDHMISDFVNAKLYVGGYKEESLARLDVVRCLGFDIHLHNRFGKRRVSYINEIVMESAESSGTSYEIRPIYQYDEKIGGGVFLNRPGKVTYMRAKDELRPEDFSRFVAFFEGLEEGNETKAKAKIQDVVPV